MIDAHVHLWQLGANGCEWPTAADGVLHRDFVADELIDTLDDAGVDRALLIQSQECARDTAWLLDVAAATPRIAGVVGWADLHDPAAVSAIKAHPTLKGLRPMVQARAADWLDDTTLDASLAAMTTHALVLDALIRPVHLPALARLAERHPDLAIVVDHAAKPERGQGALPGWTAAIAPLADHPNVHVKLSGLLTELPRNGVAPVVATLIERFGAQRLLWGSDWPVLTAVASYREWLELVRGLIAMVDRPAVFGGNAARVYGIEDVHHA